MTGGWRTSELFDDLKEEVGALRQAAAEGRAERRGEARPPDPNDQNDPHNWSLEQLRAYLISTLPIGRDNSAAARIIDDLLDDGRVARGWLGVSIQNVTDDIAQALELDETRGAIVSSIVSGGPADQAGFEREDVVLEVNGEAVETSRDLTRRIGDIAVGETVRFRIIRDGRERTLRATLGDRPSDDELDAMQSGTQVPVEVRYFGMSLVELSEEDRAVRGLDEDTPGVVVDDLERGSEAARKGLTTGDVILEAGGEPVATPDAFSAAVDEAREDDRSAILLLVETRGGQRYVALQLDAEE